MLKNPESPSFELAAGGAAQGPEILLERCPRSTSPARRLRYLTIPHAHTLVWVMFMRRKGILGTFDAARHTRAQRLVRKYSLFEDLTR